MTIHTYKHMHKDVAWLGRMGLIPTREWALTDLPNLTVAAISIALPQRKKKILKRDTYTNTEYSLHDEFGLTKVQPLPGHVSKWQHLSPADARSKRNPALWMEPRKDSAIGELSREPLKPRFPHLRKQPEPKRKLNSFRRQLLTHSHLPPPRKAPTSMMLRGHGKVWEKAS